jgi:ribosomal protein L12E/L44/L45/RPP1/RPP2
MTSTGKISLKLKTTSVLHPANIENEALKQQVKHLNMENLVLRARLSEALVALAECKKAAPAPEEAAEEDDDESVCSHCPSDLSEDCECEHCKECGGCRQCNECSCENDIFEVDGVIRSKPKVSCYGGCGKLFSMDNEDLFEHDCECDECEEGNCRQCDGCGFCDDCWAKGKRNQ